MAEIAIRNENRLDTDQIRFIAGTNFVPENYRNKLPEIMACIATGRELGLGDLESLRSIYMVNGRPSLSAELMVKLARRAGHSITGEVTDGKASVTGTRSDTGDVMSVTWTREMAERAGLLSKATWKQYPEAMLWARAVSQLCRMLFPDVLSGISYTPDESDLSAEQKVEALTAKAPTGEGPDDGNVIEGEATEAKDDGEPAQEALPVEDAQVPKPASRRRAAS